MKRKLFIGSSSESLKIAEQVKTSIDEKCSEWLETKLWNENGIFQLNASTLECLVKKARLYDYGVFIADADDCILKRHRIHRTTRDNVIFELGMFMGSLGLDRAFVISSVELPSDMNGVTTIHYKKKKISDDNIRQLVNGIESTRNCYRLGHRQSTALAIGYFNNFLKPTIDKLSQNGTDFTMSVLVPGNIADLPNRIAKYEKDNDSLLEEIIPHTRHIHKLNTGKREYWDIPRLLRTLEDILSFYEPHKEPGANPVYDELLAIELDNFCNVLIETNKSQNTFAENLQILRL